MKKNKGIKIAAMIGVVILLGMYAVTFVSAFAAKPYAGRLFLGSLLCTVFVPIFLHILIRLYAHMSERKEGDLTLHDLHRERKRQNNKEQK